MSDISIKRVILSSSRIEKHFTHKKLKGKKITIIFTLWIILIFTFLAKHSCENSNNVSKIIIEIKNRIVLN